MLGRLRMSVSDSIEAYRNIMNQLFESECRSMNVQTRFNPETLVRAVKELVKQQGLQEDTLLKDVPNARCKV
jgi:hypothetical protein